ncbi:MAG TPA: YiiD C-terminal domain-containing protein [bacterium]|nr:YiiD C-terminal domain-containing protein [bacterium]HPN43987.1 YiiD C-terminal domain-containing protein [bacterium]
MDTLNTELVAIAQDYLNTHIPITRHLGVQVVTFTGHSIEVAAPLAPNINHQGTGFGGSLASVAMLAGWTLLHLKIKAENITCRLVIQKSVMDFTAPVTADFKAQCVLPDSEEWGQFREVLTRKGKARIVLQTRVMNGETVAGKHTGTFVAVMNKQ